MENIEYSYSSTSRKWECLGTGMGRLPVFLATPICMENLPKHCHKSGMIPKDTTDGTRMMFREIGDGKHEAFHYNAAKEASQRQKAVHFKSIEPPLAQSASAYSQSTWQDVAVAI